MAWLVGYNNLQAIEVAAPVVSALATFQEKSFGKAMEEIEANNELDLPRALIEQLFDVGTLALRIESQPGPAQ
jgi:hypothetical protein